MQSNGKAEANFGYALNDFQFCLNKALENSQELREESTD